MIIPGAENVTVADLHNLPILVLFTAVGIFSAFVTLACIALRGASEVNEEWYEFRRRRDEARNRYQMKRPVADRRQRPQDDAA